MGLELFFPQQLINSMKVKRSKGTQDFVSYCREWVCQKLIKLTNVLQSKQLRKLIQQTFQQYSTLKEDDCMVKFFETLKDVVSYDEEAFPCELVVSQSGVNIWERFFLPANFFDPLAGQQQGWSLSVELVIGGRGIRQRTQKNAAVSKLEVKLWSVDGLILCVFFRQIISY